MLTVDIVLEVPLRTDPEWAGAWQWADEERALRGEPRLAADSETVVLVCRQERGADNGPWLVRSDGSRRRPECGWRVQNGVALLSWRVPPV